MFSFLLLVFLAFSNQLEITTSRSTPTSGAPLRVNQEYGDIQADDEHYEINRFRRSEQEIRGPYHTLPNPKYVELVLFVDNREYKALGGNFNKTYQYCKDLVNVVNAFFEPLNIFIVLVDVIVWSERDEIVISTNQAVTRLHFFYSHGLAPINIKYPSDLAFLITGIETEDNTYGRSTLRNICTITSGGVIVDKFRDVVPLAKVLTHEIGHCFGIDHDTSECKCPDKSCFMGPIFYRNDNRTHWSSCSKEFLSKPFLEPNTTNCLLNKPTKLFGGPVCGNRFVEAGEQCDCGPKDHCNNPCCDPNTCKLLKKATCANGECCDLKTCRLKAVGTVCRNATLECKTTKYCTGQSEFCPEVKNKC